MDYKQINFDVIFSGYSSFDEWVWPTKSETEVSVLQALATDDSQIDAEGKSDD